MSDRTTPLPRATDQAGQTDHTDQTDRLDQADHPDHAPPHSQGAAPPEPQWISGPAPTTTLAGLLALVVAVLAGVRLTTDIDLEWSTALPVAGIALGVIFVLLGVVSLSVRARRAEHRPTD